MKVRDIMTKEVKSLSPDSNAKEALDLLSKIQISGLPVIDGEGRLVGMFTEKGILRYILPSYVETVGKFIYEENPKAIRKKFSELNNMEVSQLMRREVLTTNEEANLSQVAKDMLTQKARRVLVVDKAGKLMGIVSRGDILKAFAKESQESSL